ncbi:hypothetical protein JD276_09855 [Leucobacter sp. CSA1]|uniref:Peptidoglycan lipid II flippase n=1 Tax=Leucobacter chromiisoli TaxID=2796471 RepID=A0A934Q8C9_9MICO|nr:lipid II flippase MurJ [Leucobacter chromiisoli]MBK0419338.1 hypothetical protein [Leucobacter chromiisoli]
MAASNIGRAGLVIAAGTLTSRLLGLIRSIVLVYAIGSIGAGANAFATASQVPNTVYTLIATGALTAVLVPQITKAALAADGGARYINKLVTLAIVGSGAIMLAAAAVTPLLIHWLGASWPADQVRLATMFAFWLLPQILFYSLYTVLGEVLNARSLFGPYAWSPVLNNVLNIAGLLVFVWFFGSDPDGRRGVEAWNVAGEALVAGSTTLGVAVQALILFAFWRRAGLSFRADFGFRGVGLGTMGRVAMWTFLSVLLTQATGLFNTRVMNLAGQDEAGIAAWQLGSLIFVLPHSIITISIVTARFTRMSENVHAGDLAAVSRDLQGSARLAALAMMFFTVTMAVLAYPLIRLIQPSSSYEVIATVSVVLLANLVGLVPFSLLFVFNRGFFALSDTRTPFFIQAGQCAATVVAAVLCMGLPTGMITATITLVVSITWLVQMTVTFLLLRRRIGPVGGRSVVAGLLQNAVAAIPAAAAGVGVLVALGGISEGAFPVAGFGGALVSCAAVTVAMGAVYAGILLLLRNPEAAALARRATAMIPGRR